MALDALEKEHLRRKMATKMGVFTDPNHPVSCISSHYYDAPHACELCQNTHTYDLLVVKNRSGKLLRVASSCLLEMVRYRVVEVDELPRWLEKLKELRVDHEKRKAENEAARQEEREKLSKRVIVRKRGNSPSL